MAQINKKLKHPFFTDVYKEIELTKMERGELERMMRMIAHQENSTILGGMLNEYKELEELGYVTLHMDKAHPSATMTQNGKDFVAALPPDTEK